MIAFTNKKKLFAECLDFCEFEILNELKDLSNHSDSNCLKHTRFLMECDTVSLSEQYAHMTEVKQYCCRITYSGKKSLHHIIEFAPKWEKQCKVLYKEIFEILNRNLFNGNADSACANPSRLTRRPGAIRSDTHKLQELLYSGGLLPDNIAKVVIRNAKSLHIARNWNKPSAKPRVGPKHDGMCRLYDVVTRYMNTNFPSITGNGVSSKWLFAAIACCLKYNDMETLQLVKGKAIREHWTMKELERIEANVNKNKER